MRRRGHCIEVSVILLSPASGQGNRDHLQELATTIVAGPNARTKSSVRWRVALSPVSIGGAVIANLQAYQPP